MADCGESGENSIHGIQIKLFHTEARFVFLLAFKFVWRIFVSLFHRSRLLYNLLIYLFINFRPWVVL